MTYRSLVDLVGLRDTIKVVVRRMEIEPRKLNHFLEKEGESKGKLRY